MSTLVKDIIRVSRILDQHHISNAAQEAQILVEFATNPDMTVDQQALSYAMQRRIQGEPLAYIIQKWWFYDLEFYVNNHALIPRADSETLIDAVLSSHTKIQTIIDLGVGSGCLLLTLLARIKEAIGIAIDISIEALEVSRINAVRCGLMHRVQLYQSNWLDNIPITAVDLIISNPPYVSPHDKILMSKETAYEPPISLFANNNGYEHYYTIAKTATNFLNPGGEIYMEIGLGQHQIVQDIFANHGLLIKNQYKDISGIIRCLKFAIY